MDFKTAKRIFEHTMAELPESSQWISDGLFKLIDVELIEAASVRVSSAIYGGERVWMTSDLHFGHSNIIGYCDRPFTTVQNQTDVLLGLLQKVQQEELIIFAGDMAMGDYATGVDIMRTMPGYKILVAGNHDLDATGACPLANEGIFDAVVPFLFWRGLRNTSVLVSHYPVQEYYPMPVKRLINYHGHLHQWVKESTEKVKYINVGWDQTHSLICL
jgi:calcineurin-like phosphoesterase family protein